MSTSKSPVSADDHEFVVPEKSIKVPNDMAIWQKSEAYFEYLGFILALNESVQGKALNVDCSQSPVISNVVQMLNEFDEWITQIPPTEQPQRFGNKSFRSWHARLQENGVEELQKVLPEKLHRAVPEIVQYLLESFGNPTRIDYGTGHEMAFLMFLCCMFKIGAFTQDDKVAVVVKIFNRYLELVRRLQLTYRMEPAGSHGVWSLDDYQFIPFVWGSAQLIGLSWFPYITDSSSRISWKVKPIAAYTQKNKLFKMLISIPYLKFIEIGHPRLEPRHFVEPDIIQSFSKQYMFLGCIEFISKVKIGPFAEHSNQLWNVSAVSSWAKVNSGLIKMYKAEVLAKFPVIQHVLFGSLLPIKQAAVPPVKKDPRQIQPPQLSRPQ